MDIGQAARRRLMTLNAEKIGQVYLEAKSNGVPNPAVLVMDLRDQLASQMAGGFMGEQQRDATVADAAAQNMIPVVIRSVNYEDALRVFGAISPDVTREFSEPLPDGYFWAIAIAEGGRSYVGCAIPS